MHTTINPNTSNQCFIAEDVFVYNPRDEACQLRQSRVATAKTKDGRHNHAINNYCGCCLSLKKLREAGWLCWLHLVVESLPGNNDNKTPIHKGKEQSKRRSIGDGHQGLHARVRTCFLSVISLIDQQQLSILYLIVVKTPADDGYVVQLA